VYIQSPFLRSTMTSTLLHASAELARPNARKTELAASYRSQRLQ
jgi:hypothetical protein